MTCNFSPGPPVSSTNRTDRHVITELLLKVALNTIKQTKKHTHRWLYFIHKINPLRFKYICEFSSKHLHQLYISHNVHEFSVYIYNLDINTFYITINIQMIKLLKSVEFIEQKWTMLAGPQGLVTIQVNILSMYKHVQGRTSFFTPARFKSCLFFKFLLIYSKPCLVQLPRPYSFQKISWPPLDYLLWRRSGRFCQEFAWVENNMDPKWK